MRVSFLIAAAVMLAACDTATAPRSMQSSVDDSRLPADRRAAYFDDASRVALRDLVATGFREIRIPQEAVQPYYNALVSVYNAAALPARDTVVDVYRIHTFALPATRSLYLVVGLNEVWAHRLTHDSLPTGNILVDRLVTDFALSVDIVDTLFTGDLLIVLRSAEPLNMAALAPQFRQASGVHSANPDTRIGDGNDIGGERDDATRLAYSVGYGDCPAGCIARRFYHFAIHDDGTVEYLGASGSPPPQPGSP